MRPYLKDGFLKLLQFLSNTNGQGRSWLLWLTTLYVFVKNATQHPTSYFLFYTILAAQGGVQEEKGNLKD
jgi:hypothetical protein